MTNKLDDRVRVGTTADGQPCRHPYLRDEPSNVVAWHYWAERRERTHTQAECEHCGLWVRWIKNPVPR